MAKFKVYPYNAQGCKDANAKFAEYINELNIFDSVEYDSDTASTICKYGGVSIATFKFTWQSGGYYGMAALSFGKYVQNSQNMSGSYVYVGKTNNGAMFKYSSGTIVVCKSLSGSPMLCLWNGSRFLSMTYDSDEIAQYPADSTTILTNEFYSNLCGLPTVYTGDNFIASANKVYRFVERQTSVSSNTISIIDISGTNYLTDGLFAISDL